MQNIVLADIHTITFFECPADQLASGITQWRQQNGIQTEVRNQTGSWEAHSFERCTPPNQAVIGESNRNWSYYFDNDRINGLPHSLMFSLAERLRAQVIGVTVMDESKRDRPGVPFWVGFCWYDGRSETVVSRSIMVTKDCGRWSFQASGSPLPAENVEAYGRRRIKERFTKNDILRILRALGAIATDTVTLASSEWISLKWSSSTEQTPSEFAAFLTRMWASIKGAADGPD